MVADSQIQHVPREDATLRKVLLSIFRQYRSYIIKQAGIVMIPANVLCNHIQSSERIFLKSVLLFTVSFLPQYLFAAGILCLDSRQGFLPLFLSFDQYLLVFFLRHLFHGDAGESIKGRD